MAIGWNDTRRLSPMRPCSIAIHPSQEVPLRGWHQATATLKKNTRNSLTGCKSPSSPSRVCAAVSPYLDNSSALGRRGYTANENRARGYSGVDSTRGRTRGGRRRRRRRRRGGRLPRHFPSLPLSPPRGAFSFMKTQDLNYIPLSSKTSPFN